MEHRNFWISIFLLAVSVGARAEEVTLPLGNVTLGAEWRMPEGRAIAETPVVLMTHGTLAHGRMEIMQGLQDLLVQKGYATLAINLSLGLEHRAGMYDCTVPQNHRHTDALNEIGAWLEWLKSKGATQVVLLGHSRGGNQTAWFAAERDDATISKVVLIAPMTWSGKGVRETYRSDFGKELPGIYAKAERLVKEKRGDTPLKGVGFLHCPQSTVTAATFVDYYRQEPRFDTPSMLKRIGKPVLVIVGSEDTFVPDEAKKVQPLVDGSRIQLKIVDGADHFFRDLYVEEAADDIAGFIDNTQR